MHRLLCLLALTLPAADMRSIPAGEQTGPFLLSATEITQQEYQQLTGANPSAHKGPALPVENVTWHDAIAFANRLSARERLTPCYTLPAGTRRPECTGYRLPTSAEWARAYGTPDPAAFRNSGYRDTQTLLDAAKSGTRPAASGKPNEFGLHNMSGNVWEWCEDWYSPAPLLDAIRDPQGPPTGIAKVIRGGSILTGGTQWNKALLSSMEPTRRSPFTGFRLARTVAPPALPPPPDAKFLSQFQHPQPATLPKLSGFNWQKFLGTPNLPKQTPPAKPIKTFQNPAWTGELIDLETEPAYPTRILVTSPLRKPAGRLPVVIVPYYDVDTPAGTDLGGRRLTPGAARAFALQANQRGMLAVAVKWYGEADGEGYDEAVYNLAIRHPGVTPLGKWVWDLQRVVDYITTRPDADPARIGIIGHSLGGKMSMYAAAFEPRIKAAVASEPGVSRKFSNYEDFWYLGTKIEQLPPEAEHHDLIAQMNPRPFLLIAGESADGAKSWPFLAAAAQAYKDPARIGMLNHGTGHSPTDAASQAAMEWLERWLRTRTN